MTQPGLASGIELRVAGIGLLGPGLTGWKTGRAALADPAGWSRQTTAAPAPLGLPATERRRAGTLVKAALAVAEQAVAQAGVEGAALATVFTSSTGDPLNCHLICEALAQTERTMSPTRFTNSVHNAAAGYWHIALGSRRPSTSLAAFDASFGAGLLEAAVQCRSAQAPVLLVACDLPYPEPLNALRPIADLFALALVLWPVDPATAATRGERRLRLTLAHGEPGSPCDTPGLEALRRQIPAAQALPLLQGLARPDACTVVIEAAPGLALRLLLDSAAP
jgi:hypothetical protein